MLSGMLCIQNHRSLVITIQGGIKMTSTSLVLICFIAIAIAIVINFKLNINMGLTALVFAYIIGNWFMGIKIKDLVALWPSGTAFLLISITWFFGFAVENGTMEALANKAMYKFGKKIVFLPILVFFAAALVGICGANSMQILAPISMPIAITAGIDPLILAAAMSFGAKIGSALPFSTGGSVVRQQATTYWPELDDITFSWKVFANYAIGFMIIFVIMFFVLKAHKLKNDNIKMMQEPAPLTQKQKITAILILAVLCLLLFPAIINLIAPNKVTGWMTKNLDNKFLSLIGAFLCSVLNLADSKKVVRNRIPWNPILMVTGVSTLMAVAQQAGAVEVISNFVGNNVPAFLCGAVIIIIGGFLSFFCGGLWVVTPMMCALAPGLIAIHPSLQPVMLVSCSLIGAMSTTLSPFSESGAVFVSYISDDALRQKMVLRQMPAALLVCLGMAILSVVGLFSLIV